MFKLQKNKNININKIDSNNDTITTHRGAREKIRAVVEWSSIEYTFYSSRHFMGIKSVQIIAIEKFRFILLHSFCITLTHIIYS